MITRVRVCHECLKFSSQCREASFPISAVCIASLPVLAGKLQMHFSRAFWGPNKNFGGCSQRLTLKDFTKGSCIRDILLHSTHDNDLAPLSSFST